MFIPKESTVRTYVYVAMLLVDTIDKYNTCGSMYLRGKNIRYFIKREARKRPFLHILWVSYKEYRLYET